MPWKSIVSAAPWSAGRAIRSWARKFIVPAAAVVIAIAISTGCTRPPLDAPEKAMRKTGAPVLHDDLPLEPLLSAIEEQIQFIETNPGYASFRFGPTVLTKETYLQALRRFVDLGRTARDPEAFYQAITREFDFYEVYGQEKWGRTFMTSYYEPLIPGSRKKTARFSQALYRQPDDLVELDLSAFDEKFAAERKYRGRLVDRKFVPYFSRQEIDEAQALKGRKLELCWVDPLDAFVMHIQGSGTVDLGGGQLLRLGFADKNGHRYEALGKALSQFISKEQMSLQAIEAHLRSLPPDQMQRLLNLNPSYVFFKVLEEIRPVRTRNIIPVAALSASAAASKPARALSYLGLPAVDGRTIATDPKFFPKGALAFVVARKPYFETADAPLPAGWEPMSRFVLDQDIGGAITGGGRLDLFWGKGNDAKRHAGVMKEWGTLYYLVPKQLKN